MRVTQYFLTKKLKISRQQVYAWRKSGLIEIPHRGDGGRFEYSFDDLRTLKTIKLLRDTGISTRKIRKCIKKIKQLIPGITSPLSQLPVVAFGNKIVFIQDKCAYDAISGQAYLLDFKRIKKWAGMILEYDQGRPSVEKTSKYYKKVSISSAK